MRKHKQPLHYILFIAASMILLQACGDTPIPKPKGYYKIALQEKVLTPFDGDCPLRFEKPSYVQIQYLDKRATDSCWFNLRIPKHNAVIHMTYLSVDDNIDQLFRDSYEFVYTHDSRASAIDRQRILSKDGKSTGLLYDLKGPVATPLQFYVSDSTDHFLRGSLYFSHSPNPDSIRPVLAHLRADLVTLMETIEWK